MGSTAISDFHSARFELDRYLKRIGMPAAPEASFAGLSEMLRAQLESIPFENLDVQAGLGVSLHPDDIVDKLVHRQRGGYCYEVNGLFSLALKALGVPFVWVAARPMFYPARRPRTHMAIVIELPQGRFLADLGFGSWGPSQLIGLPGQADEAGVEVQWGADRFRLERLGAKDFQLLAWVNGAWVAQYGFDLWAQDWIDFEPVNHLNSTHPDAIFVKQLLVIQHTATGRNVLSASTFKRYALGECTQITLSAPQVDECLEREFGLPRLAVLRQSAKPLASRAEHGGANTPAPAAQQHRS